MFRKGLPSQGTPLGTPYLKRAKSLSHSDLPEDESGIPLFYEYIWGIETYINRDIGSVRVDQAQVAVFKRVKGRPQGCSLGSTIRGVGSTLWLGVFTGLVIKGQMRKVYGFRVEGFMKNP